MNPDTDSPTERAREVLDALSTPSCRAVLVAASGRPMTAAELAASTGVASSTVYRTVDRLEALGLLEESYRLTTGGKPPCQFRCEVDRIVLHLPGDGGAPFLTVHDGSPRVEGVDRRALTADD